MLDCSGNVLRAHVANAFEKSGAVQVSHVPCTLAAEPSKAANLNRHPKKEPSSAKQPTNTLAVK